MAQDIDKLKAAVKFLCDIIESGRNKFKDGVQVEDAGFIIDLLPVLDLIKARQELGEEIGDLSSEEFAELVDYLKEEFSVEDEPTEDFVESIIDLIYSLYDTIQKGKILFAPKEEPEEDVQ